MVSAGTLRFMCLAFLALCVAGCAPHVQFPVSIKANKLVAYQPHIQRLLVVTDLGAALKMHVDEDEDSVFESAFMDSLGSCGIIVNVHRHDPLEVQNDEELAIKSFRPDTVMTIQNRAPAAYYLEGTIIDWKTKAQVWKAEIDTGYGSNAGKNMAASLIQILKKQSIISQTCTEPIIPKP